MLNFSILRQMDNTLYVSLSVSLFFFFFATYTGIECRYELDPPLCGISGQVNDTKPTLYPGPNDPNSDLYFPANTIITYSYTNDDLVPQVINQHLADIPYSLPLSDHILRNMPYGTNFITASATDNTASNNVHECMFVYERKSK